MRLVPGTPALCFKKPNQQWSWHRTEALAVNGHRGLRRKTLKLGTALTLGCLWTLPQGNILLLHPKGLRSVSTWLCVSRWTLTPKQLHLIPSALNTFCQMGSKCALLDAGFNPNSCGGHDDSLLECSWKNLKLQKFAFAEVRSTVWTADDDLKSEMKGHWSNTRAKLLKAGLDLLVDLDGKL